MVHRYDFDKAINLAVSHSGDSDSTGAVCGNILGAFLGVKGIRKVLINQIEVKEIIERIAGDLVKRKMKRYILPPFYYEVPDTTTERGYGKFAQYSHTPDNVSEIKGLQMEFDI